MRRGAREGSAAAGAPGPAGRTLEDDADHGVAPDPIPESSPTADLLRPDGRIVVGVDGSEQSKLALRWAARLAELTGAGVDAVLAWSVSPVLGWDGLVLDGFDPQHEAERLLNETVDAVFGAYGALRPTDLRLIVEHGGPAKVLVDRSSDAAVLVVGSRGQGGFTGLLLGSVSSACAQHARCPVLVAH